MSAHVKKRRAQLEAMHKSEQSDFEKAEVRHPLWMGLASVQASSIKHQAIKLLGY